MRKFTLMLALAGALCAQGQLAVTGQPEQLMRGTHSELYYPQMSTDGRYVTFSDANHSNLRCYDFVDCVTTKAGAEISHTTCGDTSVATSGSELLITRKGVTHSYSPVDCYAGYLWASISPDGSKVMFVAAGKGVFVTDLEGNIIAHPGKYEAPVWYGNDHIVAMLATDDGHQYHSSQIVLMNLDGSKRQELTRPESMTMYPAASAEAGKVVYNTIDGRLYQQSVTLKAAE